MKNDNGIQMEFIEMQAIYVQFIEYVRFPSNALAGHSLRWDQFCSPSASSNCFRLYRKRKHGNKGERKYKFKIEVGKLNKRY